ncbi:MAG: DUF5667 domain-containing protein [Candidatus Dojkabacteria bacterium]|jgi:hypothetical protein|nr:DUF5667 domain-containing protein [Candidatus Dojkabacteria bacterium]
MNKLLSVLLVVILLLGGGGYVLATAADAAVPGDSMYAIDLIAEDVQRALTTDDLALAELEEDILQERVDEVEQIVEGGVDEEIVDEALQELTKQTERAQERIIKLMSDDSKYDEAKKAEVVSRHMNLVQTQVQKMTEVQSQYENVSGEAKKGFEDAVVTLENLGVEATDEGAGNEEKNDESGDSGDGIKDRESNSDEDTGNDASGTANQTGR